MVAFDVASAGTISSAVPHVVALSARAAGVDPAPLLSSAGLDPATPPVPDEHVDVARYFEMWRAAMTAVGDAAFPLRAASAFQLEDHEIFGFLAMSCETLGQAYDRTAKYRALYGVGARWELVVTDELSRMVWHPWPGDPRDRGYRAAMDFAVADMEKAIRRLGRSGPRPIAVKLAHAAPPRSSVTAFQAYYGVTPTFDARAYELVYAKGLRELPVASFNSRLRDYFDAECQRVLGQQTPTASVVDRVRRELVGAMDGGDVTIEAIARKLAMSPRSLQRKLMDEGTRYQDVLSEVRADFAKRYLARKSISASEVAYLIGFREPPAFFKAFKRWTGMTPREFQLAAPLARAEGAS